MYPFSHRLRNIQSLMYTTLTLTFKIYIYRVTYKIASLTYTIRKSGQPPYLRTLISDYKPTRDLRSSSRDLIATKGSKKAKGARAFSCIAASIWNTLPLTFEGTFIYRTFCYIGWQPFPHPRIHSYIWGVTNLMYLLTYLLKKTDKCQM